MTFVYTDVIKELKELIETNWNEHDTDEVIPTFEYVYNRKNVEHYSNSDIIYFQEISTSELPSSIGNYGRDRVYNIRIDIRSNYMHPRERVSGREHLFKLKTELLSIINPNVTYSFTTSIGTIEVMNTTDLSDGLKNLWRCIYEVRVTKHHEVVS